MAPKQVPFSIRSIIRDNQRTPGFPMYADLILTRPESIPELIDLALSEEAFPYAQYASWLLVHVARKNHLLVEPFYNQIIDRILNTGNASVLRSLLGVSLCLPLREYEQGAFLDRLFVLINDPETKPGIINYAVRKLAEFTRQYPELYQEIVLILKFREEMNLNSGVVVWSKKIFQKSQKAGKK